MTFEFTEEQRMLRDSLASFLRNNHSFDKSRSIVRSKSGFSSAIWKAFSDNLGILGAPFPESIGGLGGDSVGNMIIMEELGKSLALEPWLESIVMVGPLLIDGSGRANSKIQEIIGGDAVVIPVLNSYQVQLGKQGKSPIKVSKTRDFYTLTGQASLVRNAVRATDIIVLAEDSSSGGPFLLLVPADASGVSFQDYAMVDGSRYSDIVFSDVETPLQGLIAEGQDACKRFAEAFDAAVAALCAEALGIQRMLLEWTVDYARQRKQFGRPIADFQVIKHKMAEMFIKVEESASMTYMATSHLIHTPFERAKLVSAAKVLVDQSARFVGEAAVQIHGGMGMTKELPVADYFSRLVSISQQLGSTEYHLNRYEAAMIDD